MNIIFEQYEEEIRKQSIKELQEMMPEVLSSEEYENMFFHGLQGVTVLVNESSKLQDFVNLVQSFPSVSSEDMKLINMHIGLYSLTTQNRLAPVIVSEDISGIDAKHLAVESMNAAIIAAIATAIALIIKFWDHIFSFLFSPTEKSQKMAVRAKDMKKDVKATTKSFANSSLTNKSEAQIAAYNNGKFICSPKFLMKYGRHGTGPYTNSQVIEAIDGYDEIAKEGGFTDKVIDALYSLAALYTADTFYKPLEKVVDEIEKISKLTPTIKNIDLSDVSSDIQDLVDRFSKQEAAAFKSLLSLFPSTEDKGSDGTEYHVGYNKPYGIFKNLYLYEKVGALSFEDENEKNKDIQYRELSSSIPGGIKNPPDILVELPTADERGAVTEKYLERFNASYDPNKGHFNYRGFAKHSEFNQSNFTKTMKDHGDRLSSLAQRMGKYSSSFQATAALRLIGSSKTNVASISTIVAAIFTKTYKDDIFDCETLVKEIRNHDRDTRAKA